VGCQDIFFMFLDFVKAQARAASVPSTPRLPWSWASLSLVAALGQAFLF
jgi:hypothetical protein